MPPDDDALRDRSELHDLALQYARGADRRDLAIFRQIFAEDGRILGYYGDPQTDEPEIRLEGHDAIVKGMEGLKRYEKTFHVVANHFVEIDGDRASGETYCTAHHVSTRNGVRMNYTMFIRYQDSYERREEGWVFTERILLVDWTRTAPLEHEPSV